LRSSQQNTRTRACTLPRGSRAARAPPTHSPRRAWLWLWRCRSRLHRGSDAGHYHALVASLLSVQTRDRSALKVSRTFEQRFPDAGHAYASSLADIEDAVSSINFKNQKAKFIYETTRAICEDHGRRVPEDYESLTKLMGVGAKIAKLMLSVVFDNDTCGVVVDSNLLRVAKRLGWVPPGATAEATAQRLETWFPAGQWSVPL